MKVRYIDGGMQRRVHENRREQHRDRAARDGDMIQPANTATPIFFRVCGGLHIMLGDVPQREQYRKDQQQAQAAPVHKSIRPRVLVHALHSTGIQRARNRYAQELISPRSPPSPSRPMHE